MKKRHFIVLFLFLSAGLVFYYNVIANDNVGEDKIKTVIQNTAKEIVKRAGDSAVVASNKSKEVAGLFYESVKEKGSEVIDSVIIGPVTNTAKDLTKKALLSISSSVLTKEEIRDLIEDENDGCACQ